MAKMWEGYEAQQETCNFLKRKPLQTYSLRVKAQAKREEEGKFIIPKVMTIGHKI